MTLPAGYMAPSLSPRDTPESLVMDGREVEREAYPDLWRWAIENDVIGPGMFGLGDGVSTFVLPDFSGRTLGEVPDGMARLYWTVHT